MPTLPEYKRQALEKRRAALIEEYQAASAQLERTLSDTDRVLLQRQLDDRARQIQEIDSQLGLETSPSPAPEDAGKAPAGATPPAPSQPYGTGSRWAVLVGVNQYEDLANYGRLHVCVRDVEAIRDQLVAGGFDPARIRLLTDHEGDPPTRANVLTALQAVANATERDDLLLFGYSGHGDESNGQSYLVARDGHYLTLSYTAVPLAGVREIVKGAAARAKVVLVDACHSGADIPGKGPKPMTPEFIERVFEQAEGMATLASCKQGELSYEWQDKGQSVFTHFLLEALQGQADWDGKKFTTVQDASRYVVDGVKLWASQNNVSQTPTLQYTVAGDIILTRQS